MTSDPVESPVVESPVAESLQHRLRGLTVSLFVLWLVTAGLGLWFYIDDRRRSDDNRHRASEIAQVAKQSSTALCALRRDLQRRVAAGNRFLETHPHGIAGIPAKTLRAQIDGQQRTIDVLVILDCPPEIKP